TGVGVGADGLGMVGLVTVGEPPGVTAVVVTGWVGVTGGVVEVTGWFGVVGSADAELPAEAEVRIGAGEDRAGGDGLAATDRAVNWAGAVAPVWSVAPVPATRAG